MDLNNIIAGQKSKIASKLSKQEIVLGESIFNNGQCQVLSQSPSCIELFVSDEAGRNFTEYNIHIDDGFMVPVKDNKAVEWDKISYACLLQAEREIHLFNSKEKLEHKKYTRDGMIKRVLDERRKKADKARYRIQWAPNIYGDHVLLNEKGIKYTIFLRDFENETGYSNSMDSRLNKLGTTKHLMFAFKQLKEDKYLYNKLDKTFPFIEVFCDPLNDNKVTWFYPYSLCDEEQMLFTRFFKGSNFIEDTEVRSLLDFVSEASSFPNIKIRQDVIEKIENSFEVQLLEDIKGQYKPDFSCIKAELYPYQKEGIQFALFKKNALIADEMGLGKTIQAIGTAILKKEVFDFKKTLIICPASLKQQWKKEIEKFSDEKAVIVDGLPSERSAKYQDDAYYFYIVNYETVLRDQVIMNKAGFDFLILDEVQRAKNYETLTASSVKRIEAKHKLAITGTPIENRLIDIFSIMGILDPSFFGPLWEFSYQHCLFDSEKFNKINGYYDLQKLNKKLESVLIRREKRKVISQLPNIVQTDIPVNLSPLQADYHGSCARSLAQLLRKKFMTPYDMQKMQLLLANMRMVCDSTYLIDEKTNESPKLEELKYILFEKLDIANRDCKIIIFSEWIKVHKLIGALLRENNVGFVELSGNIPVKMRGELISKFEQNPQFKIFLSTEAGGSGLNLQVADTLINFELPWNPAKKNQRIGRIDRIGQRSKNLLIFNLITRNSIEQQIATGLLVKQGLFDGVLGDGSNINYVDFSTKGRSQFIKQLEEFLAESEKWDKQDIETKQLPEQTKVDFENITSNEELNEVDPDEEITDEPVDNQGSCEVTHPNQEKQNPVVEMETVMNSGMQFLAGLFKMTTGKDMGIENQKIEVNKETGEVVIKFKMPV